MCLVVVVARPCCSSVKDRLDALEVTEEVFLNSGRAINFFFFLKIHRRIVSRIGPLQELLRAFDQVVFIFFTIQEPCVRSRLHRRFYHVFITRLGNNRSLASPIIAVLDDVDAL